MSNSKHLNMDTAKRIREAIKQTEIATESAEQQEVVDFLQKGSISLENALESVNHIDEE